MRITALKSIAADRLQQAAELLVAAFREHWPDAWPDMDVAVATVKAALASDRISRVAHDDAGAVVGWIGGISGYRGHAWELHPLAVRPDRQRRGIGTALVRDLELAVRRRGATSLYVLTDDEDAMTSLGGADLYPDVLTNLARIRDIKGHPFRFYQKLGVALAGVIPDANGPGKPDILLAKRIAED